MVNILFFIIGFFVGGLTVHYNPEIGNMLFTIQKDMTSEVQGVYQERYEKPKPWYDIF